MIVLKVAWYSYAERADVAVIWSSGQVKHVSILEQRGADGEGWRTQSRFRAGESVDSLARVCRFNDTSEA